MGVVDQRLAPRQHRVAGDPECDRPLVDPVRHLGEAVPLDPPLIEGEDVRGRLEDADLYLVPSKSQVCSTMYPGSEDSLLKPWKEIPSSLTWGSV